MTRLSSRSTWLSKRVFPIVWFGFVAVFFVISLSGALYRGDVPAFVLFVPILMGVLGWVVMKQLIFGLADEVWDAGSELVVRKQGREARIRFADIVNVSYSVATNPQRVTLRLRQSGPFGKEITFAAPTTWIPFAKSAIIEDLITRVDEARSARR